MYTQKLELPNYDVQFDALGEEPVTSAFLSLMLSNYVTVADASAGAWMLLEDKPLSVNVETHTIRLPAPNTIGRPATKRKASGGRDAAKSKANKK